jgi:ribosome-associated translation inhibitor RaiA
MLPIQITYHGIEPSDALTELIHTRSGQIDRLNDRIHALRVLVDAPHHHQRHGRRYRVRLELTLPGRDLVVGHDDDEHVLDDDAYQAVRRAFDALRRKLTTTQMRRRGKQRAHAALRVAR